jgi:hypothetical protein
MLKTQLKQGRMMRFVGAYLMLSSGGDYREIKRML